MVAEESAKAQHVFKSEYAYLRYIEDMAVIVPVTLVIQ